MGHPGRKAEAGHSEPKVRYSAARCMGEVSGQGLWNLLQSGPPECHLLRVIWSAMGFTVPTWKLMWKPDEVLRQPSPSSGAWQSGSPFPYSYRLKQAGCQASSLLSL